MPRRLTLSVVVLTVLAVLAMAGPPLEAHESAGARRNLAQGRDALARKDYPAAVAHLRSAVSSFDPARDREELGDAWLQLGIASLNGLGKPEEALSAFLASAAASPEPSTAWLWASVAAEKLDRTEDATLYRTRAVPPPAPAPAPAPVAGMEKPAPQPEPEPEPAKAAPQEKPDAVQHFFGEAEPQEKAKDEKDSKDVEDGEKKDAEKVDAFEYFFGEKKEKPAEEKPPGL